jgi:TonB-linked SusC/RagA family outer membrane protein
MLMLCGVLAFAQTRVVSGKVTDADGKDVPFATVKVKGTNTGVSADANGSYSIKVKTGDVLTISGAGFKSEDVAVGNQTNLLSVLQKSASSGLQEIVVTGALNRRVNAKSVGYASTTIGNDDITRVKAVNVQQGLQGKVAGLNVQSVNSGVLGETRITLRGIRSLTGNNQPLLVIDGVPIDLNLINTISPNDVQDVTVLKSNSAAILYGQDGANGAILITTKKGTRNKPTINFSTTVQFDKISFLPKLQNEYGPGETEDANGLPVYDNFTNNSFGPRYNGTMVPLGHPLENGQQFMVPYSNIPNERYNFFNTGVTLQNDISISGGDKDSRFLFSVQDAKITGVIPSDRNRRTSIRFNSSRDFSKLSVGFNLNYVLQNSNTVLQNSNAIFTNGRGQFDDIYTSVIKTAGMVPLTSLKNWRSNPYADADGYYNFFGYNPYMLIDIDRTATKTHNVIGSVDLNYKISPVFSLTYRLGSTVTIRNQQDVLGAINVSAFTATYKPAPWGQSTKGAVRDLSDTRSRISSEFFLNFKKNFNKFSVDGLVGNSILARDVRINRITGNNLVIPNLNNPDNRTGEPAILARFFQARTVSAIAQATVGYDNKVFVTFSGRNDWDSRFSKDNNSYFYPGANASLIISEIIPSLKGNVVSSLKLKGSYAKSGNANLAGTLGAYQLDNSFTTGAFPYGNLPGYSIDDQLKDPNIKPEFVTTKEVGFELAMLKNKMRLDVNIYQQDNDQQIVPVSLPASTGYTSSNVNAGSFVNKGIEVEVGLTPLIKLGKLSVDLKANYTYQENKVTKIYPGLDELGNADNGQIFLKVGYPAYIFKLIDYNRDPEGKVIVDANTGQPSLAGPRRIMPGGSLPKHIFGISPTFSYGNISISALGEYRGGHYIYNDIGQDLVFNGIAASTVRYGRQPFVWPNSVIQTGNKFTPNTNIYTRSGNANLYTNSIFNAVETAYYTRADFWKLREVALTYTFPQSLLNDQKLFKAISASFIARNVALWVPKSNEYTDPEFSNTTGNGVGVTTTGQTPPTRSLGVTFNFTF